MKKLFLILSAFFALAAVCAAQASDIILMPGTGASYTPVGSTVPKKTESTPFEEQLQDALAYFRGSNNPVIMGHSQGGMRAFALAKLRKETGQSTAGVISMGGPVCGFSPLAGGVDQLKNRVVGIADDLLRGADAMLSVILLGCPILPGTVKNDAKIYFAMFSDDFDESYDLSDSATPGSAYANFLISGMMPANEGGDAFWVSDAVIRDFSPGSAYVKQRLDPGSILVREGYWTSVLSGYEWAYRWSYTYILGVKVGYWELYQKPVYTSVYIKPVYSSVPQLSPSTCVSYIYGTNGDPAVFANEYQEAAGDDFETKYPGLAKTCDDISWWMGVAQGIHVAESVTNFAGSVLCPWLIPIAVYHVAAADDAGVAKEILADRKGTLNGRILNTTASDGLVPTDCVTRPLAQTGGQVWATDLFVIPKSFTHQRLHYDDSIWGIGGSIDNGPRAGGLIYRMLLARRMDALIENGTYSHFD